jgi:MbtH protein
MSRPTEQNLYKVVINHEEQYTIWPAKRELPIGWRDAGKVGTKAECLAYIDLVLSEVRPAKQRRRALAHQ